MLSIIRSHFHKGKTGFLITGLFIALSVMMMIIGLSICFGMDGLYYNARNLSNSPDLWISVFEKQGGKSQRVIEDILNKREDVEDYDVQQIYYLESPKESGNNRLMIFWKDGGDTEFNNWAAMNADDEENKFSPRLRDVVDGEGYKFYVTGNFIETSVSLGDEVIYRHGEDRYKGYIAGIYDDATRIYSHANIYVDGDFYKLLAEFEKDDDLIMDEYNVNIRVKGNSEAERKVTWESLRDEFVDAMAQLNKENIIQQQPILYFNVATRQDFTEGTRGFILLLGASMIAFAVIVAAIVAVVIAFLVRSSVLDEVRNLGVWKALGYTTRELRTSYLAIYGAIGGSCIAVGAALGVGLMPTFVGIITEMARLDCSKAIGASALGVFIAIAAVAAILCAAVYFSTSKVKRITPLSALRSNIATHSFKRNRAPLEKSKMPVDMRLGVKSAVGEIGRSATVVVIVLIMSLLCSFVSVVYYNLKVDQRAVINMSAVEDADFYIAFYYEDPSPYFDAIRQIDGFEGDALYTRVGLEMNGAHCYGQIYSSFEHMRTKFVYSGRYPKYANEIMLEEQYAKRNGIKIGDSVNLLITEGNDESQKDCIVVGYFQNILDNVKFIAFTDIIEEFVDAQTQSKNLQHLIYFQQGKAPTLERLDEILRGVNGGESVAYNGFQTGRNMLDGFLSTVETAASAVMSVFFCVTAIVIALLLVILTKLKLLRERRNFAIYKALGYTTANIMTQIAVAMTILGVIGSVIGGIVGALVTSPMLSLFGEFIGAGHFAFAIPWGYTVAIVVAVPALIFAVSMLCAIPVRKIRPATLLRERG